MDRDRKAGVLLMIASAAFLIGALINDPRQPLAGREHQVEAGRGQTDERLESLTCAPLVRCQLCVQGPEPYRGAASGPVDRSAAPLPAARFGARAGPPSR